MECQIGSSRQTLLKEEEFLVCLLFGPIDGEEQPLIRVVLDPGSQAIFDFMHPLSNFHRNEQEPVDNAVSSSW